MGPVTFAVLATALVVSALTVVVHPSPVKSAMALVATLFLISGATGLTAAARLARV